LTERVFRGSFLVVLSLFISLYAPSPVSGGSSGLSFNETTHDFGRINRLSKQKHTFAFKNTGDRAVVITEVVTSCGCTAAVAGRKKIVSGGSGEIEVTFDPTGKSGKFFNVIKVLTDASPIPYAIYIKGDVRISEKSTKKVKGLYPVIEISPKSVNLGRVRLGQAAEYKIVVANRGEGELFVTNFHTKNSSSGLPLSSKPIGKGIRVELTASYICDQEGIFEDFLIIRSNDPENPSVQIRITGIVE